MISSPCHLILRLERRNGAGTRSRTVCPREARRGTQGHGKRERNRATPKTQPGRRLDGSASLDAAVLTPRRVGRQCVHVQVSKDHVRYGCEIDAGRFQSLITTRSRQVQVRIRAEPASMSMVRSPLFTTTHSAPFEHIRAGGNCSPAKRPDGRVDVVA